MFSTDGFVIFRLIRRQPYSEMKRSGIERSMARWRGEMLVFGVRDNEKSIIILKTQALESI